ncbi:MAG: DUF1150 family protein [Acetobacteraceae bacterium]
MNANSPDTPAGPGGRQVMVDIRHITQSQLGQLGVSHVAYVKPVLTQNGRAFAIHGADGAPLALAPDWDLAVAAILQQEMVPVMVH